MRKVLLAMVFALAMVVVGCQQQKTTESAEKQSETPEEVTITNIGSMSFKQIDINEDGRFTYDEFDKVTKNAGSAEGNTVYAEFDVDGNGIISEEEFSGK